MSTLGSSNPSTPKPSNPSTSEAREQQLENERNILDRVHHYQREYPEVAPDVINSIYLSFLEVPEDDRPEFDEYLKFKQKLMELENRIFKLPPDQLDQVLKDNGGSLAVIFLNVESNPLDILDEGEEGRLEVEEQQFGYQEPDEKELEDKYEDEQEQEEKQEDEEREEGIQEDEELEEEYGDEEEMEKNQKDQDMYQEDQELDYGHQQMDMVEDVQEEIVFAPIEHSVQYDANQLIHQAAELAVHEEEEERLRKIRHRFRQENPILMSLLGSE
ncbi:hypothetical protein CAEBREN_04139 [Caenorhabditis brenneri]|uniref:Uncharacterized protein n=1 Tax=Caenorhabditis brenneri TaxID=135651 RepID=G0NS30_CAEBE|nr:hypothetical protein CAEBREN_04139 [Caenorhabditis brenneri]